MIEIDSTPAILKSDIEELEKIQGRQPLFYDSVLSRLSKSSNQHDFSLAIPAGYVTRTFKLSATPVSGSLSIIRLQYYYTWDIPDVMPNAYQHTNTPGIVLQDISLPPIGSTLRWGFAAQGDDTPHTLYVKVQFISSDEVTWSFS